MLGSNKPYCHRRDLQVSRAVLSSGVEIGEMGQTAEGGMQEQVVSESQPVVSRRIQATDDPCIVQV